MKKILTLLAIALVGITSCKPEEEVQYSISVEPTELTFDSAGGEDTVCVTSSEAWNLVGDNPYWCQVSSIYGDGNAEIVFTVESNEDLEYGRTATFRFVSGDKEAILTVTQEKREHSISIEPSELIFGAEEGGQEITVTSSSEWNINTMPDWIETSEQSGKNREIIIVTAKYNAEVESRSGEIVFTCGDKEAIVSVTQKADDSPIIQFNNPDFEKAAITQADFNADNKVSEAEAASLKSLLLSNRDLTDLSDIKFFINLTELRCYNNRLTSLNLSNNTALEYLDCDINQLTSLDLSNNTALTDLSCSSNQLTSLDVSNNTALTELRCYYNQLTSLDLSNNTALTKLYCYNNDLTSLDVSNNTALTKLYCLNNDLTSIDLRKNTELTDLQCSSNQLIFLDLSNNTALTTLWCDGNQLTSLDLSNNTALTELWCSRNPLRKLIINKHHIIIYVCIEDIVSEYGDIIEYVD